MRAQRAKVSCLALTISLMLWGITPGMEAAERELHWDALDVDARLDAGGMLDVIERHTMVFTGDWNGGERVFDVRPHQKLEFLSIERLDARTGEPHLLRKAPIPDHIDEFFWPDTRTLRWRSRMPSDPPFASTRLIYVLHYKLSGILLKDEQQYTLDNEFAFSNRPGSIARFSLNLALDPVWHPIGEFHDRYTAGPLAPSQGFVLTIPLRYAGTSVPAALDGRRPPEIVGAVIAILGMFVVIAMAFLVSERSLGRFAPIDTTSIDTAWIEKHILVHPAELVGAAWDGRIGTPEVVALIARMTVEGKLESETSGKDTMTLRLKIDRSSLDGHERALVDGLFFDNRTETNTKAVQQHYRSKGFDPVRVITPKLKSRVNAILPPGKVRAGKVASVALFLAGAVLLVWTAYRDPDMWAGVFASLTAFLILCLLLQIPGMLFKPRIDWGEAAAAAFMIPAMLMSLGTAAFLWIAAGTGQFELPLTMIGAITLWAICISNMSINGLKSRQDRAAIAFRKSLAAGRRFFQKELEKPKPGLSDNWYPWLLSFGLGKQVDVWSSHHAAMSTQSFSGDRSAGSSSSAPSTGTGWTGGGGLSGGAGASGAWAAAAAGMAAGVAAPSSSSSSGGGSSSSGGSSGGGGGGGW